MNKKYTAILAGFLFAMMACLVPFQNFGYPIPAELGYKTNKKNIMKSNIIKVKIGSKTFTAVLEDNETATAFKALLPLTIKMEELNGNEKHGNINGKLPLHVYDPRIIKNGDLMIWSTNTLVLFYKSFSTRYSYTKLGQITDTTGLEAAVGSGEVTVRFEQ
jgi:hypothetical protein